VSAPTTTRPARTTVRTTDDVAALGTVLGVWAHPDDELYLSGGVLAAAVAAGQRVVVVTATRGEHGTDDPARWPPARLVAERSREITASLAALDPQRRRIEHRFLGDASGRCHLDGALVADPGAETVDELAAVVAEVAPDTVLTFGPDGITGHRDHRAVSAWTDRALRRVPATPRVLHAAVTEAWVRRFGEFVEPMDDAGDAFAPCPDAELVVDLELGGELVDRKVAALRAQATQTAGLEAVVGAERYRTSVAGEYFRPAPGWSW
jgi:LmbE family N-acetylglucosaminyl deacetylase